ncbi:hypothetical protein U1Q18_031138 [Sarracenia purpurea var. burkii]
MRAPLSRPPVWGRYSNAEWLREREKVPFRGKISNVPRRSGREKVLEGGRNSRYRQSIVFSGENVKTRVEEPVVTSDGGPLDREGSRRTAYGGSCKCAAPCYRCVPDLLSFVLQFAIICAPDFQLVLLWSYLCRHEELLLYWWCCSIPRHLAARYLVCNSIWCFLMSMPRLAAALCYYLGRFLVLMATASYVLLWIMSCHMLLLCSATPLRPIESAAAGLE